MRVGRPFSIVDAMVGTPAAVDDLACSLPLHVMPLARLADAPQFRSALISEVRHAVQPVCAQFAPSWHTLS
jgi:hypothetical protein